MAEVAHGRGMKLHVDGARLANALAFLGCEPAEITWRAGVDVLSFGATKNGALAAEAVVFFDPAPAHDFELRRKRAQADFSGGCQTSRLAAAVHRSGVCPAGASRGLSHVLRGR